MGGGGFFCCVLTHRGEVQRCCCYWWLCKGKFGVISKSSAQKLLGEGTAIAEPSNSSRVRNNLLGKAWKWPSSFSESRSSCTLEFPFALLTVRRCWAGRAQQTRGESQALPLLLSLPWKVKVKNLKSFCHRTLDLPGAAWHPVIISLCPETPTSTLHFTESLQAQRIQLLKCSGGSVLCLSMLQTAPGPQQVRGKAFNNPSARRGGSPAGIHRQVPYLCFPVNWEKGEMLSRLVVSVMIFFPFIQMLHWNTRI